MSKKDNILLDTCVLMFNPDIIQRVNYKGGNIFITNTILDELDFNKKGSEDKSYNVRKVLKEFRKSPPTNITEVNNLTPLNNDIFSRSEYNGFPVYIIHRNKFNSSGNNDSKIIELVKDYSLILITSDNAMVVRANSAGVPSHFWEGDDIKKYSLPEYLLFSLIQYRLPSTRNTSAGAGNASKDC